MKIMIMGKGLVGTIVAHRLKQDGHEVTTVDAGLPNSGAYAAGFLMHHSWFKERKNLIDVAVTRYGARPLGQGFAVLPLYLFEREPDIKGDAYQIINDERARQQEVVVWCLGSWDTRNYPDMSVRAGVSFRWRFTAKDKGQPQVSHSFWAPFKSNTKALITDGTWWAADGAALLPKNLTPERIEQARERVGAPKDAEVRVGHRPYTAKKGLMPLMNWGLKQRHYAINGAGKIGCLLAIDAAEKLALALSPTGDDYVAL